MYSCNRLSKAVIVKINYHYDSDKRFRNGHPVAQDAACYHSNFRAAPICRRTASSELHVAGAYRHDDLMRAKRCSAKVATGVGWPSTAKP
jgi:hypothetical protein